LENKSLKERTVKSESEIYLGRGMRGIALILFLAGLGLLILSFIISVIGEGSVRSFLSSYLVSFCYFLSLALGGLFFVMLQFITRASWSVVIRRIAEFISATFPFLLLMSVPILFGLPFIYKWADRALVAQDPLLQAKSVYLNIPFFVLRVIFLLIILSSLSLYFYRISLRQDKTGSPNITVTLQRLSAPGLIIFAFALTFLSFDLVMSLAPHWYSTIFGVYFFAGSAISIFAFLIVLLLLLEFLGKMRGVVSVDHYHDLGKFLFGFLVFWAYLGFSQYMLIWYANIPEETAWYVKRQSPEWVSLSIIIVIGHFVIPFFGLLSRFVKRRKGLLGFWAVYMLLMHYLDLYWLIMPELRDGAGSVGIIDVLSLGGFLAMFLSFLVIVASGRPLIPIQDPRLSDSLKFAEVGV